MRRVIVFGILMMMLVLALAPVSAQDNVRVTEAFLADFEAFIESEMSYFGVPGASVAIIENGEVVYVDSFGVSDVVTNTPVTTSTLFRAGSITKSMTSMLIAQLVDEGVLDWDTPVRDILPDFDSFVPNVEATIRVRDLMGMNTGLVSNDVDGLYWGDWTADDLIASLSRMQIGGNFGEYFSYNNEVYALSGYIATSVTGNGQTVENYVRLMEERLFTPMLMDSTIITDDASALGEDYASSYGFTIAGGLTNPAPIPLAPIGVVAPSGAVWTNITDMANYAMTQMNDGVTPDGTQIVSTDNLHETWQGQIPVNFEGEIMPVEGGQYGMGWITQIYQGIPMRYHDGGWEGFRAMLAFYPDADVAIVILTNSLMGELLYQSLTYTLAERLFDLEALALDIAHSAYEEFDAQIEQAQAQLPPPQVEPADVADYLGDYENGWLVELREDNTLWLVRSGWEVLLHPLESNTFITASGTIVGALATFDATDDSVVQLTIDLGDSQLQLEKLP